MATVRMWTGFEAAILRTALRLSVRAFAEHLGVAVRTVVNWESKGTKIRPLPDMQAILDTALARANAEARERFTMALEVSSPPEFNGTVELHARLTRTAAALDADLVELFEQQTQAFRLLDRRLGAGRLLTQASSCPSDGRHAHVHAGRVIPGRAGGRASRGLRIGRLASARSRTFRQGLGFA